MFLENKDTKDIIKGKKGGLKLARGQLGEKSANPCKKEYSPYKRIFLPRLTYIVSSQYLIGERNAKETLNIKETKKSDTKK